MNTRRTRRSQDGRPQVRISHHQRFSPRRGMTVVVVLAVISITLAVSYALVRSQTVNAQIQQNGQQQTSARQAAETGMLIGIRRMHEAAWPGVLVPISDNLEPNVWYEVSYTTGDSSLAPADPDYHEYPYRVTITSTGYASHPDQPSLTSQYTKRSVMQLVRRRLAPEPDSWNRVHSNTVVQWGNDDVIMEIPARVEGTSELQGKLRLADSYPPIAARDRYLSDLEQMRKNALGDHRPFSGPLKMPLARNVLDMLTLLTNALGLTTNDTPINGAAPAPMPGSVFEYHLYPGGIAYEVPLLSNTLGDIVVTPDPVSNPLGVYRVNNTLKLNDNVTIEGTMIASGGDDIEFVGTNIRLQAANLAGLQGDGTVYQLPVAIVEDKLIVQNGSNATVDGMGVVGDTADFREGTDDTGMQWQGAMTAKKLVVNRRHEWNQSDGWWTLRLAEFLLQEAGGEKYFPRWLENKHGLPVKPNIAIKPPSQPIRYHWQDWNQPVYVPHQDDPGLRWDVVRWQ